MKKTVLRSYANLIIRCGLNVQKGQEVIILAELDQPEFVKMLVEEAYKAKAGKVTAQWRNGKRHGWSITARFCLPACGCAPRILTA